MNEKRSFAETRHDFSNIETSHFSNQTATLINIKKWP